MGVYPEDPNGDLVPILQASIELAKIQRGDPDMIAAAPTKIKREELPLSANCDQCGVPAAYRLVKGEQDLDFCGHHFNDNELALVEHGWEVVAERTFGEYAQEVLVVEGGDQIETE